MASIPLIDNKDELKQKFLEVATYLFERGEMVKAYRYISNCPSFIEEDKDVLELTGAIKKRLGQLSEMTRYGSIEGKFNRGFIDPTNVEEIVKFKRLRSEAERLGLKKLVDVGCHTGWIGRNLNLLNIAVHGIDVQPWIVIYAGLCASGTLATHEFLPAEKLGFTHPLEFDGAVMFDVLEHVFDPELAIKSAEMSVKDGGWLFYNIPHPEAEHLSPRFPDPETREHLNSFSETKLKKLFANRKNLIIERINNEEGSFNWWLQYQV